MTFAGSLPRWRIIPLAAAFVALAALPGLAAFPSDARFSSTLSPAQRVAVGFDKLSPDNVAAIDALVRRDSMDAARPHASSPAAKTFSARRSPQEREIEGFSHLSADELSQLDALVALQLDPPTPLQAAAESSALHPTAYQQEPDPWETSKRLPQVHGSVSLTMGWGKGGSFQGGDALINIQDPAHHLDVLFGYSEYHGKGLPSCLDSPLGPGYYGSGYSGVGMYGRGPASLEP